MSKRDAFAGGDQRYLRDEQYATSENLDARARLHREFATATVPFHDWEAALIDWPPDASVLECGCGSGRFWESPMLPRSIRLTLTDLSPGMVSEAVERAGVAGFVTADGRECDVQALPFDDCAFDVVIANHMLYHVPDPDRALAEIARVLTPDGVVLASTNGYGHMREINDLKEACFGGTAEKLFEVFGIDTGEQRLREHFAQLTWHAYDNDLVVDDPAAVVAYGLSFPPGSDASGDERARFAAAVHAAFVDGTMRIHTRSGAFVGRDLRV